jgi:hypothetical protein
MTIVMPSASRAKADMVMAREAAQAELGQGLAPIVLDPVTCEVLDGEPWPRDCCCDCPGCRASHPDD